MTELDLKTFFEGTSTPEQLATQLAASARVEPLPGDFEIEPAHLIRLCDAVLAHRFAPQLLERVASILIASDQFHWDNTTAGGARVADVLFQWDAPELHFPLDEANVARWKRYLEARV